MNSEHDNAARFRADIRRWLRLEAPPRRAKFTVVDVHEERAFERQRVIYETRDGDSISAFLLVPKGLSQPSPGVIVHHQHNGERHLGKSEVCGLIGDPNQAFGPSLAEKGIIVLAPDSICFEDRRSGVAGTAPHPDDWKQHYNQMSYRLLRGDTLMRKVLEDAELAVSVLAGIAAVDPARIGIVGHSYGGNTVLFQAALDERVRFCCSSGAACSFRDKMERGTGIEMAEVLPGVLARFDVDGLLGLTAPRPALIVSASDDEYSHDASAIVQLARSEYAKAGSVIDLQHAHFQGGHSLDRARFDYIVTWLNFSSREPPK
ncbi:MAG: acetylxylan esterase [Pseudomonadota bacterium]